MRALPVLCLGLCLACSEWRLKPTFPEQAAGQPVVYEQAIVGLNDRGDAAVAELIDAGGALPRLDLAVFAHDGAPTRVVEAAAATEAREAAQRLREAGRRPTPVLREVLLAAWPEVFSIAADLGFAPPSPAVPEPGRRRWLVTGVEANGALPLALRLVQGEESAALVLSSEGTDAELARMPLAGSPVAAEVYLGSATAWLVAGSVGDDDVLHRTVGVRHGSLLRGEAELHNQHGLDAYAAGELDVARREFDRAIDADPEFVDALYNAAASAALIDRTEEAVALLRRAAQVDPRRVQVLGRDDDDLKLLRRRADVRALLGLRRPPPE